MLASISPLSGLLFFQSWNTDLPLFYKIIIGLLLIFFLIHVLSSSSSVIANEHWQYPFSDLQMSSQEFYKTMEEAINDKKMPGVSLSRITLSEGPFFSANREYLRIERNKMVFDICAAPFGRAFFISWWQGDEADSGRKFVSAIPFIGKWLENRIYQKTYFQIDAEQMFQTSIHDILLAAVDAIATEKGVRGPTELERKPIAVRRQR